VVYDHRKVESVLDDQKIANAVAARIKSEPELKDNSTHINVTCFNHVVVITGETSSPELRQKIEESAHSVRDITRIYNQVVVTGPSSSLSRTSDSWITAKIKSQMLATKDLQSGTIKVVTESGAVYLMGMVSHEQADTAVDIARQVSGVRKVIKVFQYKD
jgi:osmotically-inducible protein OsmY